MKVELKWITPDAQTMIVYIARVSNPKSQEQGANSERLIEYLIRHRHWSPFQMASACYSVETTRDISRQIIRHRSQKIEEDEPFCIQEFSQRYADPTALGFVFREARLQDQKNRQASIDIEDRILQEEWREWQRMVVEAATSAYRWAVSKGIAKECARAPLPEGMTPSRIFMAATIRDWIHYCNVRTDGDTQKEHRLIAEAIWADLTERMPAIAIAGEVLRQHEGKPIGEQSTPGCGSGGVPQVFASGAGGGSGADWSMEGRTSGGVAETEG
jgi:thymidylate synthase (FAD)